MVRRRPRRNLRKEGFVFPTPLLAVLLLAAMAALSYLWLSARCEMLAGGIREREARLARLREERRMEEFRWWSMASPERIVHALRRRGIRMDWPRESQVFYVDLTGSGVGCGPNVLAWRGGGRP
ncbi:MAG TPA: hypothetical protein EYP62_09320 [Kiritimatiellae bacterium]|nr:hypothetical protein [Kiritimatiellia bacterium]